MPTYTDPATGRSVMSADPLSPDEIAEALSPPQPSLNERMPLVTEAMAGEGPPPRPFGMPPASDFLPNPLDLPGLAARTLGLGPVVDHFNDPANAIALTFPTGASVLGAMGLGGASAVTTDAVKLAREHGTQALSPDTLKRLGWDFLLGSATAGVMRGATDAVFGRPHPERSAAEAVLGAPAPPTVGAATEEARQPFLARVNQSFGKVVQPVSDDALGEAYQAFPQVAGDRPIDVTEYNRVLDRFAAKHFPEERQAVTGRLFDPVGTTPDLPEMTLMEKASRNIAKYEGTYVPQPIPPGGQSPDYPLRTYASAEQIMASDRGINNAARLKNPDGSRTLPGGLMKQLKGALRAALDGSLTEDERAAYRGAQALALRKAQMDDAVELLTGANENGLPRPDRVFHALDTDKTGQYVDQLGPALHAQVKAIAGAGKTLMHNPLGRRIFAQVLARMPGTLAGAAIGSLSNDPRGTIGGAVAGAAMSPAPTLLAPAILEGLQALARHRAGSEPFIQAAGRLAVSMAIDATPEPDPRSGQATSPQPLPLPTATPRPLGRVGTP